MTRMVERGRFAASAPPRRRSRLRRRAFPRRPTSRCRARRSGRSSSRSATTPATAASRAIQAAGDDQASGQPAAAASAASAPYQIAAASMTAAGARQAERLAGDARRGERQQAGGDDLGREIEREGRAPQPRPAHLPRPDVAQAPGAERLLRTAGWRDGRASRRGGRAWSKRRLRRSRPRAPRSRRPPRACRAATASSCPGRSRSRSPRPHIASAPGRC